LHKAEPGVLKIDLIKRDGYIEIIMEDDGVGRNAAIGLRSKTSLKTKSHGLDVTARRIANFNGNELDGESVSITDLFTPEGRASGTRVFIRLALMNHTMQPKS
jgi:hypothetical protein